jgi:hypothetical protein
LEQNNYILANYLVKLTPYVIFQGQLYKHNCGLGEQSYILHLTFSGEGAKLLVDINFNYNNISDEDDIKVLRINNLINLIIFNYI